MEDNGPKETGGCFLSKIINMMSDLYQLAEQHNINSRLYSSDGLERIYQIIGYSQITR